ncbi:MAG: ubiquinol-cytochrome c reductase iron-sulfur subunit [Chloroflexi bacterium]|nr:ubiquinol-cytochrome c reductase iron-sulfur subunit [Chloroflexota bacterium]
MSVENRLTRRELLAKIGWGALAIAAGSFLAAFARFLQPNVTTPAPGPVEIGTADEYPIGSLSLVENARAYVGRDERGFYAIIAICTHLGCTPRLEADAFACPCHGSRFTRDGTVVNGPAGRALDRALVGRAANGKLFVDRSRAVDANYRLPV